MCEGPESDIWVKSYDHLNISRASIGLFRASRFVMCLNRTSEWKVMTIWISLELPLFYFERRNLWCAWIGHPSEKFRPFEFFERFRCSISSISMYYVPQSDLRVKSYDHLNISRVSIVQFRASRFVMRLNWTSEWNVMTIWICRELPLFNYKRLVILCAWIRPPCYKLWPFEYLETFHWSISSISIYDSPESDIRVRTYDHFNFPRPSVVQFRASLYIKRLNRAFVWKVMTIWISLELPLINFERLYMWYTWIEHSSEKLWPFEFLESYRCSISSVSIYYAPESDLCVKSYDHFNLSRAYVVQFRASRYIKHLNRTSVWKVMTIWISLELPLFNFERLDMWYTWIGNPSEKLWPFEFLHSFRCSISCISICEAPESDIWVKSFDHLNISRGFIVQFWASQYVMRLNPTSECKVMTIWISS